MLKNVSNLGSVLNKTEQKSINGGGLVCCARSCDDNYCTAWAPSYLLCPDQEPPCF